MNYIKSVEENFEFLPKDLGYEIESKEDLVLFKYVRYRNNKIGRLVSVHLDLRENSFDISVWRLTDSGEELDSNSFDLSELIIKKKIRTKLTDLPANAVNKNLSKTFFDELLGQRVTVLKKYFFDVINGKTWI